MITDSAIKTTTNQVVNRSDRKRSYRLRIFGGRQVTTGRSSITGCSMTHSRPFASFAGINNRARRICPPITRMGANLMLLIRVNSCYWRAIIRNFVHCCHNRGRRMAGKDRRRRLSWHIGAVGLVLAVAVGYNRRTNRCTCTRALENAIGSGCRSARAA